MVALLVAIFAAPALLSASRPAPPAAPQPRAAVETETETERPQPTEAEQRETQQREPAPDEDAPIAGAPPRLTAPISFDRAASLRIGRIIIPSVGLDATFGEGVQDAILELGPGHWPGTPLPGEPGNSVLSGHRTTWTHPFGDLDLLAPGDVITTGVGPDSGVEFRVTETRIIPESEYVDAVLAQPADPAARTLTLFACHPKGRRTHRIVVTAAAEGSTQ